MLITAIFYYVRHSRKTVFINFYSFPLLVQFISQVDINFCEFCDTLHSRIRYFWTLEPLCEAAVDFQLDHDCSMIQISAQKQNSSDEIYPKKFNSVVHSKDTIIMRPLRTCWFSMNTEKKAFFKPVHSPFFLEHVPKLVYWPCHIGTRYPPIHEWLGNWLPELKFLYRLMPKVVIMSCPHCLILYLILNATNLVGTK